MSIAGKSLRIGLLGLGIALAAGSALAQTEFQPQVGQAGKDVIWVPTPLEVVDSMLSMAKTTPQDFVVDLGSGDGRTVIRAAKKFGARAMGVEFNPDMVSLSNRAAQKEGVTDKAKFVNGDIFQVDFSQATVVTMYLLPDLNVKLRPKILDMKPGTRVASHQFTMGDWQADEVSYIDGRQALLWIVPAKVAGNWRLQAGSGEEQTLGLKQNFQTVEGTLRSQARELLLTATLLRGDQIGFSVLDGGARRDYRGRVSGNTMEGTMISGSGAEVKWRAIRRD